MSKEEFLNELRIALQGEVSQNVISENIQYYDRYIAGEIRKGRILEEIMEELGNPRLIARTIIDTNGRESTGNTAHRHTEFSENNEQEQQGGFRAEYENRDGWNLRFGRKRIYKWYEKLLFILCIVGFFVIAGIILNVLLPFILIGIGIWFITSLINKSR